MKNSPELGGRFPPRPKTPSLICRILHILRKPNPIIAKYFITLSFVIAPSLVPFFSITSLLCWLWFSSYISPLSDNVMGQLLIKVMFDFRVFPDSPWYWWVWYWRWRDCWCPSYVKAGKQISRPFLTSAFKKTVQ